VALLAVHPTLVFFAGTQWAETVYVTLLGLLAWSTLWAREGGPLRGLLPGFLLGLTVLVRGVATYLAPVLLVALLLPRAGSTAWRARSRHAAALLVALVLTVAPYSVVASVRWGGLVISDATLGHVMALGNDDFEPVTFDYGNGQLTGRVYGATLMRGRADCPRRGGPVAHDRCEVQRSLRWIGRHPGTFLARVPERLAQLLNPHSFLTRQLRWHAWHGIPWALEELLVAFQACFTALVVLGGTLGAWARARGPVGALTVGIVGYHVAVVAALYGLTRFRLPLEPLWIVWLAAVLAAPRDTVASLRAAPGRLVGAALSLPILLLLMARYAWTGWPGLDVLLPWP
ncbi:MAG: hypothetical protein KC656_25215, partial [Myxococcales bacterium]|nr:hypothetical protein [Myxococcales bacterium]